MTTAPQLDVEKCREVLEAKKSASYVIRDDRKYEDDNAFCELADDASEQLEAALTLLAEAREFVDDVASGAEKVGASVLREYANKLLARIPDLSELT